MTTDRLRNLVTPRDAGHVLMLFNGDEGVNAGSFTNALLEAINKADGPNTDKLFSIYPGPVVAVMMMKTQDDGLDFLRERFKEWSDPRWTIS